MRECIETIVSGRLSTVFYRRKICGKLCASAQPGKRLMKKRSTPAKKQEFWLQHLRRHQEMGGRLSDYAKANDLNVSVFYNWIMAASAAPKNA